MEYSRAGVRKHSDRLATLVNRDSSSSGIREIRLCQSLNRCVISTRTKSWHTKTFPRVRQFNLERWMGLEGFPVRVPLLVSSVLFSPLLKNSQNTKVDNYMYLGHSFFNYHALFQMSPMDELPVPSDWPTTSKFSRLPCSLENAEYTHTQTHTHIHIYIYIYI